MKLSGVSYPPGLSGVISVELNYISLWPALCFSHLELGESQVQHIQC